MAKKRLVPTETEKIIMRAIRESGMTQPELEEKSGVSQATISRFMSDDLQVRRTVTLPVADRLCRALGLKLTKRRPTKKERKNA